MKRFLLPLLAALALPTACSNSDVSNEIHKRCKDVKDYVGCVQIMGGQKKENEYGEGTRKFIRKDGNYVLFNPLAVRAMEEKSEYGRYLSYRYIKVNPESSVAWTVEADCEEYTADWDKDKKGWVNIKNPSKRLDAWYFEASKEAVDILDEFCPQMDSLVKETKSGKEFYRYPISTSRNTSGGGGGGGSSSKNQFDYKEFKQNEKIRNLENRIELDKINKERGY